jgi:hypothetical protein
MSTQQATIVPDGGGFRCSACKGGVRRDATSCKHCGLAFVLGQGTEPTPEPSIAAAIYDKVDQLRHAAPPVHAAAIYDKVDQLRQLEQVLLPGESIEAVFDIKGAGLGFIGITSKRVVFHDKAFLRKLKAIVSIPYSRIASIATEDEAGVLTGRGFFSSSKIYLTTSHSDHEFEFRGADKAHTAHNLILAHMV